MMMLNSSVSFFSLCTTGKYLNTDRLTDYLLQEQKSLIRKKKHTLRFGLLLWNVNS